MKALKLSSIYGSVILSLLFLFSCGGNKTENTDTTTTEQPQPVKLTIKGSDTVLPLSQSEAENFMKKFADASITVVGGGSGVGISALIDGTTDICQASRDLKTEEELKLQDDKKDIKKVTIAF